MEEKKVRLKKEDIDFLCNKFIEITEDCVIKGYNIDNVQHEFGKLFLMIKDSDTKLNLKPFDLEAAKAGKPVCTRDGRKAKVICFDRNAAEYHIVALIECKGFPNKEEEIKVYNDDGKYFANGESSHDLMMLPEKKEGWVNVYYDNGASHRGCRYIYDTKEQAIKEAGSDYITTVKIEWEE